MIDFLFMSSCSFLEFMFIPSNFFVSLCRKVSKILLKIFKSMYNILMSYLVNVLGSSMKSHDDVENRHDLWLVM